MATLQPQDPRIQIEEPRRSGLNALLHHDFLSLAFRPFFLLTAGFSTVSLLVWLGFFLGQGFTGAGKMAPVVWHVHEMIFGFAATVAAGFVLTAVQTWTKLPSLSRGWILLLIVLWITVRIGLYLNSSLSLMIAVGAQVLWWAIALVAFTRLLILSQNRRNYLLVPLMTMIASFNIAVIISPFLTDSISLTLHLARTAILVFVILMGLIGGRVIPFFTASGARIPAPQVPSWMTPLVATVSVLGASLYFISDFIELPFTPANIMILGGILHIWRLSYWQSRVTVKIPLLWSLHLAYLLMALGLIMLGASYYIDALAFSDSLHMITIGAIGLMIFSMMSRVSLGHTGRALQPSSWVNVIYFLLLTAVLARVGLAVAGLHLYAWLISALCWVVASLIFIVLYAPILWRNPSR